MRHPVRKLGFGALALVLGACSDTSGPALEPPVDCDGGNTVTLDVGAAITQTGPGARTFCVGAPTSPGPTLQNPSEGAEYLLVPFAATSSSSERLTVVLRGENVVPLGDAPDADRIVKPGPFGAGGLLGAGERAVEDPRVHLSIRELERRELGPLVRAAPGAPPAAARAPATVPNVGDLLTLNAQARSACQDPILRTARVEAVTERAIVVADTLNPAVGFTRGEYEGFGHVFDTLITRVSDRNFGAATDLTGTGRVILFFTQEVNRLSEPGSNRFVGGFFFARDLFPRAGSPQLQACAHSNEAEVLYLMVPGTVNGITRTRQFVARSTPNTLVHEHQHLVNAARRLHILRSAEPFEDVWLNEALSHTAEELLFFEITGLEPRSNLGLADLQQGGAAVIEAANAHLVQNVLRFEAFLRKADEQSAYAEVDGLEARGASQHLLRYLADHRGGDDAELFRALVDAPEKGFANLAARLGGEAAFRNRLGAWSVSVFASERVPGVESRFLAPSWDYPSLLAGLDVRTYPIRTRPLPAHQEGSVELVGGAGVHFRFALGQGEVARIVFNPDGSPLPGELQVTLLRTR